MTDEKNQIDKLLESLQERAKELNCLYRIEELMNEPEATIKNVCQGIIEAIPPGWQYPDICQAKIIFEDMIFKSENLQETDWVQSSDIHVQDKKVGTIYIYYIQEMPLADFGPFLKEETKLIGTIAERLGHFIMYHRMKHMVSEYDSAKHDISEHNKEEWQVVLELLRQTDKNLYLNISHKMLNYLCWSGVNEAEKLRQSTGADRSDETEDLNRDSNRPHEKRIFTISANMTEDIFRIASDHLSEQEISNRIQKWIQEDKLSFLVQVVNRNLSLSTVADAIRRYHHIETEGAELHSPSKRGVTVSLIRRFLSDQLPFINIAKNYVDIGDFYELLKRVIFSPESHGKLGGKSAGLYLAARIIEKSETYRDELGDIMIPKTWHITSDMLVHFMHYNNFDEIVEQKYKDINQVRYEYPHIVQTFKNSRFPPEMITGISVALDDFGENPIIVRSSSLLEDRAGAAFSGKYKSLFLANQGTKAQRLDALLDAIAEVYASTFSPDPIEYRAERGLIDFGEEMGILLQEVVGKHVGHYYLPAYAGVAFSNNEFRWSPRIHQKDGLIRLVAGLGTRAVDRLADDYPVLIAPGQPKMRVNTTIDEILRYAPKKIDVINLKTNSFETIEIAELMREFGAEIPGVYDMISIYKNGNLRRPMMMNADFKNDPVVVTFDALISNSKFVRQIESLLKLLEDKFDTPVDIEFAHDGDNLFLLQCRPQSYSTVDAPSPIPPDLPEDKIVFTANRYVTNGQIPDITHIVYVDPVKYAAIEDRKILLEIGRAVGKLNKLLPKRQFILMGPGRWGSHGDIRLGVDVTYSDINNSAVLIEIARKKGQYTPDLSFGTHFFQDLVEANIRYIPLYPDDPGIKFNEQFLLNSPNILPQLLPAYAYLEDTLHLIDVPQSRNGRILKILLNADLDEAVALLSQPSATEERVPMNAMPEKVHTENYWRWRMRIADLIASHLDPERFGVKDLYIFGSTKNASAGPGSDIDLIVHFIGTDEQRKCLDTWLESWNYCVDEMNYQKTGYQTGQILDIHYVTDKDILEKSSYAIKIGAVTDPARPLKLMKPSGKN